MVLLKPNTVIAYIDGAHFYGTAHKYSDLDLVLVEYQPFDDILHNINPTIKQTHSFLDKIDYTRYDFTHFVNLIAKGNIQLIEKVICAKDEHILFKNDILFGESLFEHLKNFAYDSMKVTNWGHIRGWMRKTLKKVEVQGWTVKRAMLVWRMVLETNHALDFMESVPYVDLICQFPEIMKFEEEDRDTLMSLYELRLDGINKLDPQSQNQIEMILLKKTEKLDTRLENYEPVGLRKDTRWEKQFSNIHERKQNLIWHLRHTLFEKEAKEHYGSPF